MLNRRNVLTGLIAAPMIVRPASLMPIKLCEFNEPWIEFEHELPPNLRPSLFLLRNKHLLLTWKYQYPLSYFRSNRASLKNIISPTWRFIDKTETGRIPTNPNEIIITPYLAQLGSDEIPVRGIQL